MNVSAGTCVKGINGNKNGFVKYNEDIFCWNDQIRLRDEVRRLKELGAYVLISNAAHESVIDIYDGIGHVYEIERASVISGKSSGRGATSELLISVGYELDV